MAYLLVNNILSTSTVSATTFVSGSEQSLFTFDKSYDGNPSTGFKSATSTQPKVIINFTGATTIDAIGIYAPDSSFTVNMKQRS